MSTAPLKNSFYNSYDLRKMAESLRRYSVDYIETENQKIKSTWYHSELDFDVFIWHDETDNIIKQQVNLCGEVLEWNILKGLRSGVLLEKENEFSHEQFSEEVVFDNEINPSSLNSVLEILSHCDEIAPEDRVRLEKNIRDNPTIDTMSSKAFYESFGNPKNFNSLTDKKAFWHNFWQFLKYKLYIWFSGK